MYPFISVNKRNFKYPPLTTPLLITNTEFMKKIISILTVFIVVVFISSCARKMNFATSPVVPAATGSVKVKNDNNDNYTITVKTVNLAEPKNLTPARNTYVVWMEGDNNTITNLGQIKTSSGLFSKTLKGELKATATTKPDRIFITAEDDGTVQYPGNHMVLQTR